MKRVYFSDYLLLIVLETKIITIMNSVSLLIAYLDKTQTLLRLVKK